MSDTPAISIALCTYNGVAYLKEQLNSIIGQSYSNLEIIIIDDASTDGTKMLVKEYSDRDSRIKFIINEKNIGYNKNFEKALSFSTGEWIAFADQDDIWHPEKIKIMVESWNGKSLLLYCSSKKFTASENINITEMKPSTIGISGSNVPALSCKNCTEGHTMLLHKSAKSWQLPAERIYYDWWFGVVASVKGEIQWINKLLVWRRIHTNNAFESQLFTDADSMANWVMHLNAIIEIEGIKKSDKDFLYRCITMYNEKKGRQSWFFFIFANRHTFFYYKRKKWFVSMIKNSMKLSKKLASK